MALSQQTIDEMKAGMQQVATNEGGKKLDPAYVDALLRTGMRAKWLKEQEKAGRLTIERRGRAHTNNEKEPPVTFIVRVGDNEFEDFSACVTGQWPSEVLVASVALALGAGEDLRMLDTTIY